MDPQELISTLKAQHRTLQSDLSLVSENTEVVSTLDKFRNDLLEHLKLENETFYPDYLDKKSKRGEDLTLTKEFITQMEVIGKVVIAFLEKYSTSEAIKANEPVFKGELRDIISTLNTRIETEEEGVFGLYLLL